MLKELKKELENKANPQQAEILQKFFKTKKGQYGEGDIFLGLNVPQQRAICKSYENLSIRQIKKLLKSKIHEHRLCGLFILIALYKKADKKGRDKIFKFYLKNAKRINNWDLVDLSAPKIVGEYLIEHPKQIKILEKLANSKNLWEKRIAMVATFSFIKKQEHMEEVLKIAGLLLKDSHDLIHKAVGWMLREFGKKDMEELKVFLRCEYKKLPRTTLRYAIEKFPEGERKKYLEGKWKK